MERKQSRGKRTRIQIKDLARSIGVEMSELQTINTRAKSRIEHKLILTPRPIHTSRFDLLELADP